MSIIARFPYADETQRSDAQSEARFTCAGARREGVRVSWRHFVNRFGHASYIVEEEPTC